MIYYYFSQDHSKHCPRLSGLFHLFPTSVSPTPPAETDRILENVSLFPTWRMFSLPWATVLVFLFVFNTMLSLPGALFLSTSPSVYELSGLTQSFSGLFMEGPLQQTGEAYRPLLRIMFLHAESKIHGITKEGGCIEI